MLSTVLRPLLLALLLAGSAAAQSVCLVTDFGAVGDGRTVNTRAIQEAIDACHERGGGTVWVPAGTFVSGTLELRSRVRLHLDAGATLDGSTDLADYPIFHGRLNAERAAQQSADEDVPLELTSASERARFFLLARGADDLAITGTGTLDGRGGAFAWNAETGEAAPGRPLYWILIEDARRVTLRDVRLVNPTGWGVSLRRVEDVVVDGVSLTAPERSPNTDGFDLRGVRRGRFSNLYVRTGDDAICFKAQPGEPSEDVVITNSVLQSDDAAIKFGTGTHDAMRRVLISNVQIVDSRYGIAVFMRDGGLVEDVRIENVRVTGRSRHRTEVPLYLDIDRRTPARALGAIRRFTVSGLEVATRGNVLIGGQPAAPIEDLTLENVTVRVSGAVDLTEIRKPLGARTITPDPDSDDFASRPAHVTVGNVRGLRVRGLRIDDDGAGAPRAALHLENVEDALVDDLDLARRGERPAILLPAAVRAVGTRGLVLGRPRATGFDRFLDGTPSASRPGVADLAVQAGDLRGATDPWALPEAVRVRHKGMLFAPGRDPGLAPEERRDTP